MSRPGKRDEENDGDATSNPFFNLEKSRVLQEARKFNEMPIVAKKCGQILTKIIYLICQGEHLGASEATDAFFAATKLFQCPDTTLRSLLYLTIKEMAPFTENVIIVTSSLSKDMTGKQEAFRSSALRALCHITDSSMLQGIERYMKQAIVDKNPAVSAAALVSSLHLMKDNLEVVKRWVNEVQQALSSKANMVQYHALGLLYHMKQKDRLAIAKLVATQMKSPAIRSPHATCLLIRYAVKVIEQDPNTSDRSMHEFIDSCLRNRSEIVIYEAARALVSLPSASPRDLASAVSVLQLFLSSPKATLRFAAIRTLNKVAISHPAALKVCNLDMENLVTDSNRSIATLAITTLLKTGSEANIDRLMKQISSFLSEISDEFKIVVVEAIQALCLKFPAKHGVLMGFLAGVLRDEGGFEYKKVVVDTIVCIVKLVPEAKEAGLAHLCEFIEDCEYTSLLVKILHIIGHEGPYTPSPRKFIRFVYNRLILENATVRAAAVHTLARFGAQVEALRPSVLVLLSRCIADSDDEVRDRATFFISMLTTMPPPTAAKLVLHAAPYAVAPLESALVAYLQTSADAPFNLATVPLESPTAVAAGALPAVERSALTSADHSLPSLGSASATGGAAGGNTATAAAAAAHSAAAHLLASVPQFASFGPLVKSTPPTDLTESETEYVVRCTKHLFAQHVVFMFTITNTLNDQVLENARVVMEGGEQALDESDVILLPAPKLTYNAPGNSFIAFPLDSSIASQTFSARLDFVVKDCDPDTGDCDEEGYEDTYTLEDVQLQLADIMQAVDKPNFSAAWDELAGGAEQTETFELPSMTGLEDAVGKITKFLGMAACEQSRVVPPGKAIHTLLLAGVYAGGVPVLARAKLAYDSGIALQLTVRSVDASLCAFIAGAIGG